MTYKKSGIFYCIGTGGDLLDIKVLIDKIAIMTIRALRSIYQLKITIKGDILKNQHLSRNTSFLHVKLHFITCLRKIEWMKQKNGGNVLLSRKI